MKYSNVRYETDAHTSVLAEVDGVERVIPVDLNNPVFVGLIAQGIHIDPAPPRKPTSDEVRAEASRRMQVLLGVRDEKHLAIVLSNDVREAVRLLRKGENNWSKAEARRAAELEDQDTAIEAIRAASNALEPDPPFDYTDDAHWPSLGESTNAKPDKDTTRVAA